MVRYRSDDTTLLTAETDVAPKRARRASTTAHPEDPKPQAGRPRNAVLSRCVEPLPDSYLMRFNMRQVLGLLMVVGVVVAIIWNGGRNPQQLVLDATARMERVAKAAEHTNGVSCDMRYEIMRLIHQPWSDCNRLACRTLLGVRNRVARVRLESILSSADAANCPAGPTSQVAKATH